MQIDKNFPHTLATVSAILQAGIWLTENEAQYLLNVGKSAINAVEIGCAYGGSTCFLLAGLSKENLETTLTSIDPFVVDSMDSWSANRDHCYNAVNKFKTNYSIHTKWILLPEYSYNIAKIWTTKIDLLFIDGSHHYKDVKQDFDDWFPFVDTNGFILIHDSQQPLDANPEIFNNGWPGPSKLVRELLESKICEFVESVDSLTIMKKL